MNKILFPEANNEYIQAAAAKLAGTVEPILVASDMPTAVAKVQNGEADAIIAGIDFSTRDVILGARDVFGMREGYHVFTSVCVAYLPDGRRYILSDCATCKNPSAEQLAEIVELANDAAAKILDDQPRVAMLSFSTFGSGTNDPSLDKIHAALDTIRAKRSDIVVDGEMQLDAAVNARIGEKKSAAHGGSPVAGQANVLIVPDINAGNILVKSLEQFAGAKIAGPILLGFNKPISDLSRGSTVEDIILTAEALSKLL
jgi:phosphotransacetylase